MPDRITKLGPGTPGLEWPAGSVTNVHINRRNMIVDPDEVVRIDFAPDVTREWAERDVGNAEAQGRYRVITYHWSMQQSLEEFLQENVEPYERVAHVEPLGGEASAYANGNRRILLERIPPR